MKTDTPVTRFVLCVIAGLVISLISISVFAQECELPPKEKFEDSYEDFDEKLDDVASADLVLDPSNDRPPDALSVEEMEDDPVFKATLEKFPGLKSSMIEMAQLGGEALNAGMMGLNVLQLAQAVESNNKEGEIVSGVNLGLSIGLPVLQRIISQLISEAVGEAFGGIAGFVVMEGMNIWTGIKDEKDVIDKIEYGNVDMEKEFQKYMDKMDEQMNLARSVISGDREALISYDTENIGTYLFNRNKPQIVDLTKKILSSGFQKKAANLMPKYLKELKKTNQLLMREVPTVKNVHDFVSVIDKYVKKSAFLDKKIDSLRIPSLQGNYAEFIKFDVSSRFWEAGSHYGTMADLRRSVIVSISVHYQHYYAPLIVWYVAAFRGILLNAIYQSFDHSDMLINQVVELLNKQEHDPNFQKGLVDQHNKVVREQYAWFLFGKHLLEKLNSDLKKDNFFIWQFRALSPILEGFSDGPMMKELYKEYGAAGLMANCVAYWATQKWDILTKKAQNNILKTVEKRGGDTNDISLLAISEALTETISAVNDKLLSYDDIKPLKFSLKKGSPTLAELTKNENSSHVYTKSLNSKLKGFIESIIPMSNPDGVAYELHHDFFRKWFSSHSYTNSFYFKQVTDLLSLTTAKLKGKVDNYTAYKAVSDASAKLAEIYASFRVLNPSAPGFGVPFVGAGTLIPFMDFEMKQLQKFLSNASLVLFKKADEDLGHTLTNYASVIKLVDPRIWEFSNYPAFVFKRANLKALIRPVMYLPFYSDLKTEKIEIACASYDGKRCLWGVDPINIDFEKINPMVCGTGAEEDQNTRKWCSLIKEIERQKSKFSSESRWTFNDKMHVAVSKVTEGDETFFACASYDGRSCLWRYGLEDIDYSLLDPLPCGAVTRKEKLSPFFHEDFICKQNSVMYPRRPLFIPSVEKDPKELLLEKKPSLDFFLMGAKPGVPIILRELDDKN